MIIKTNGNYTITKTRAGWDIWYTIENTATPINTVLYRTTNYNEAIQIFNNIKWGVIYE